MLLFIWTQYFIASLWLYCNAVRICLFGCNNFCNCKYLNTNNVHPFSLFDLMACAWICHYHASLMVTCAKYVQHATFLWHTEFGSESFEEFLDVLGEKIRLRGWERFRGGLDVKGGYNLYNFFSSFSFVLYRFIWWNLLRSVDLRDKWFCFRLLWII